MRKKIAVIADIARDRRDRKRKHLAIKQLAVSKGEKANLKATVLSIIS